ncbi:M48 family metalloprotease [Streptomyces cremeus]|uniref:M48 family metalloprotease n=1 Tax=Streptomyces cremeus TaxID=66881 RepID=A0ABV5PGN4_STRCM
MTSAPEPPQGPRYPEPPVLRDVTHLSEKLRSRAAPPDPEDGPGHPDRAGRRRRAAGAGRRPSSYGDRQDDGEPPRSESRYEEAHTLLARLRDLLDGPEPPGPWERRRHPGSPPAPGFAGTEADDAAEDGFPPGPVPYAARPDPWPRRPPAGPGAAAASRLRLSSRERRMDATAVCQLLTQLPWAVCSALLIGRLSSLLLGGLGWLPLALWAGAGLLVFHRSSETLLARYLLRLEHPSGRELDHLRPLWAQVTARAGVDGRGYALWIEDSRELTAFATGRRIVAVTRQAVRSLPDGQLAAVLAHELGHQREGHSWAAPLGRWYGMPARALASGLRRVLLHAWLRRKDLARSQRLTAVLVLLLAFGALTLATWGLPLALLAGPFVLGATARRAEYRADRHAAVLGYGPQLASVLERSIERELADRNSRFRGRRPSLVVRLLTTRADTATRLHRLRPYLETRER